MHGVLFCFSKIKENWIVEFCSRKSLSLFLKTFELERILTFSS